ncbi:oligosaccharide flippase family protein [Novosphingobium sp. 17-62-19]|uniref:lipopolysaccharide biosynthesis protein n=1 Tax=Novosphingobium sp. 17-62-19 TaxID=1970406 RepID=UPI0025D0AB36|nr:oligosaccharide flippase family protein [Novosphingobium sp. 17-62-19]HQS96781.1 oligosaccharide flippase family protein [Novosphingobium sp.]
MSEITGSDEVPVSKWAKLRRRLNGVGIEMLIAFVMRFATAGLSFVLNWMVARKFGPEGAGLYAIVMTTGVLFSTFAALGLDIVIVRTIAVARVEKNFGKARKAIRQGLLVTVVLSGMIGLLFVLGNRPISEFWVKGGEAAPFILVTGILIPILAAMRLLAAALRAIGKVALSQVVQGPLGTGTAVLLLGTSLMMDWQIPALYAAIFYTFGFMLCLLLATFVLHRETRHWPVGTSSPMLLSGMMVLGSQVTVFLVEWFATLMLTNYGTTADAGIFRVCFQIGALFGLIMMAAESIMGPHFAALLARNDIASVNRLARNVSLAMIAAGAPLMVVILAAPEFLLGLFGEEFKSGANALRIISLGQMANIATGPVASILLMARQEKWTLTYGIGGCVIAGLLSWFFVPIWGVMGAAVAVSAGILFRRITASIVVRKVVGVRFFG